MDMDLEGARMLYRGRERVRWLEWAATNSPGSSGTATSWRSDVEMERMSPEADSTTV